MVKCIRTLFSLWQWVTVSLNADDTPLLFQQHLNLAYTIISYKDAYHATNKLVLAALRFGKKKPDIDLFLDAFVETMTDSSQNDLVVEQNPSRRDFSSRHLQTVRSIKLCSAGINVVNEK